MKGYIIESSFGVVYIGKNGGLLMGGSPSLVKPAVFLSKEDALRARRKYSQHWSRKKQHFSQKPKWFRVLEVSFVKG